VPGRGGCFRPATKGQRETKETAALPKRHHWCWTMIDALELSSKPTAAGWWLRWGHVPARHRQRHKGASRVVDFWSHELKVLKNEIQKQQVVCDRPLIANNTSSQLTRVYENKKTKRYSRSYYMRSFRTQKFPKVGVHPKSDKNCNRQHILCTMPLVRPCKLK
jgi:hypothetical protein